MIPATEGLERLIAGNRRFTSDEHNPSALTSQATRDAASRKQQPFAVVLGCSDSRVPSEIVFDQGIGDLFVIRIAGNVAAPSQIGSVEYAAEALGVPLVVVLGHSNCGAVSATLGELTQGARIDSPNLQSIVNRIRPAVEELCNSELRNDPDALLDRSIKANIRASVQDLKDGSKIIENLMGAGKLTIVGAEYSLSTGRVEFFDRSS